MAEVCSGFYLFYTVIYTCKINNRALLIGICESMGTQRRNMRLLSSSFIYLHQLSRQSDKSRGNGRLNSTLLCYILVSKATLFFGSFCPLNRVAMISQLCNVIFASSIYMHAWRFLIKRYCYASRGMIDYLLGQRITAAGLTSFHARTSKWGKLECTDFL